MHTDKGNNKSISIMEQTYNIIRTIVTINPKVDTQVSIIKEQQTMESAKAWMDITEMLHDDKESLRNTKVIRTKNTLKVVFPKVKTIEFRIVKAYKRKGMYVPKPQHVEVLTRLTER